VSKTPRLVNPTPHKPTIYPAMKLPKMVSIPKTIDPGLAQLGRINQAVPAAPVIGNRAPTMTPGGPTNRPGVPTK
jgi:hypothetical protein